MNNSRNRPIVFRGRSPIDSTPAEIFIAMKGDKDSNYISFEFDRYYNGADLGNYVIQLIIIGDILPEPHNNIITETTGLIKTVTSGRISVKWRVGNEQTYAPGTARAQFKFINAVGSIWLTNIINIRVESSLDVDGSVIPLYPDVLEDHEARIQQLSDGITQLRLYKMSAILSAADWIDNTQRINIINYKIDAINFISPAIGSVLDYRDNGVYAAEEGDGYMVFKALKTPINDIKVNIVKGV